MFLLGDQADNIGQDYQYTKLMWSNVIHRITTLIVKKNLRRYSTKGIVIPSIKMLILLFFS